MKNFTNNSLGLKAKDVKTREYNSLQFIKSFNSTQATALTYNTNQIQKQLTKKTTRLKK